MSYGAKSHSNLDSKKSLSFLCFFPGQLIFPVRDALYANQGGTTKKVLKAITLINSDHWGIPAYHFLSFLFFQFCTRYCSFLQSLMFVLPDLLLMNYSASCILQGSMSVSMNKRQ